MAAQLTFFILSSRKCRRSSGSPDNAVAAACCFLSLILSLQLFLRPATAAVPAGSWKLLVQNGGVSAMHMTLTYKNTVVMFDRTDYGPSQLKLPAGKCRTDPKDLALKVDCYAHSIEYTIADNSIRPLEVMTDTWCSSGGFLADGTLVSTGGYNDGGSAVRRFYPCSAGKGCDWSENYPQMGGYRWYATNQVLPDGSMIVVGGRSSFSYEFVPSKGAPVDFPFLRQTNIPGVENNLYPFLHLSPDGNLFVFADRKSILLDYKSNKVVRTFPDMPGGGGRNYPSSGSSVLLPLSYADGFRTAEIMICGGAPDGSYKMANTKGGQVTALQSCGRLVITDANPKWQMSNMPSPRVMGDMLILPTGEILIINGGKTGTAGWGNCLNPNLNPVLYNPGGGWYQQLAGSTIPRLYHSTASLLPDGRVLVGGSNPNVGYSFSGVPFATELRLEAYSPYYLDAGYDAFRPRITGLSKTAVGYGAGFMVEFALPGASRPGKVEYRLYAPPFTTHTYSMNQRQLLLASGPLKTLGTRFYAAVTAPPNAVAAPAGYYLIFVVNAGIPSPGSWIHIG